MHFVLKLSKLCNLRCSYCNEYDELGLRDRMPLEGLEFFIRGVAEFAQDQGDHQHKYCFVFHGGEPLLLPDEYLKKIKELQEKLLSPRRIRYRNLLQSNLYKISKSKLELLKKLEIGLGISLDVFGSERLTITGRDSQDRVIKNLQMLSDIGYLENPGVGAISVLHRENIENVEATYDFFNELGLSYRILPLESSIGGESPARLRQLAITNEEKVTALKRVARRHAQKGKGIRVLPLDDYFQSAVRYLAGATDEQYGFPEKEWALIINTNGDTYNSGDAYFPTGYIGNIYRETLKEMFAGTSYAATVRTRMRRMRTCEVCPYETACPKIPVAEMETSERQYDWNGLLQCTVARPLIDHYVEELLALPEATEYLDNFAEWKLSLGDASVAPG